MSGLPPTYIQLWDPDITSMEDAMDKAFRRIGLEKLGGASGKGWSRYNVIQTCARKYQLRYLKKLRGEGRAALEIGSAFHAFCALYYYNMIQLIAGKEETATPSQFRDLLFEYGANADYIAEGWRLFDSYADYYEDQNDYLEPIDVEVLCVDPRTGNSCRYDLIARVDKEEANRRGIQSGIVAVDHKSAHRLDVSNTEGWQMHGELIGQMYLWRQGGFDEKYGVLAANVANVVTKTKIPSFHREWVTPPDWFIEEQGRALDCYDALIKMYEAHGYFPKALAACYGGKYGACDYVDVCKEKLR